MGRYTAGGVGRDILVGAAAGVAAMWVADKLDRAIYRAGSPDSIRKSEAARPGGLDPAHVLAKRAADAAGVELEDPKANYGGRSIHFGAAAAIGAAYGLLRGLAPGVSAGRGALFGVALFILKDEIGHTALGTAGNPLKYPLRDHGRGAATHALFGVVTDTVLRVVSPWRDEVVIERGPPLSERIDHGRQYLLQGRDQLTEIGRQAQEQGRGYLEQGRGYIEQGLGAVSRVTEQARARLPDVDADKVARRGRRYAGDVLDTLRSRAADLDVGELAKTGSKQARRLAEEARDQLPNDPLSSLSRAVKRLFA
ncbi:MAG: hypothetical protein ACRYGM_09765 [Janthinobacterium lividum]